MHNYSSPFLKVSLTKSQKKLYLHLTVLSPHLYTSQLPHTLDTLRSHLPQVLTSECFNDAHLPFDQEVKATEIGHLFEHILIQHLCEAKLALGFSPVTFSGFTSWNWYIHPRGEFKISLDVAARDIPLIAYALPKTIALTEKILMV